MRGSIVVACLGLLACRKQAEPADAQPSGAAVAAPASAPTAMPTVPSATPAATAVGLAAEMPPATGSLVGRPFVAKKGVLRRIAGGGDTLTFWDAVSGDRCEHQLALDGALFLELAWRRDAQPFAVDRVYSETELLAIYPTGGAVDRAPERVKLVVDQIDEAGALVRGRLDVSADDGTAYSGSFEAAYCPDGVVPRARGGTIAGVSWGEPPAAKALPEAVATAEIGGTPAPIVHAVAGRLPDFPDSPLFLDLFTTEPPARCALHIGSGVGAAGFLFALGVRPARGDVLEYHGTRESDAVPPVYAKLNVRPNESDPFTSHGDGDAIVVVDEIDRSRVRGRVYAAFRDPGKSMVVGSFDAPICADADVQ